MDIVKIVNDTLDEAIAQGASDVHIEAQNDRVRVRLRQDGVLYDAHYLDKEFLMPLMTRLKILGGMDIAERRKPQDGRFSYPAQGREIDLRLSTVPLIFGEKIVIRILDEARFGQTLSDIIAETEDLDLLKRWIAKNDGMILMTGPTGCGKTTTLYAIMSEENKPEVNITTLENPVEYRLSGINQIQINEAAGICFDNMLRSVLRQDPDTILIGELRDRETAEIAIRAAITGHKVYGTLHTTDTYGSILRLLNMGVPDYLIKAALTGVLAQRLVRVLCPACKKERALTDEQKSLFEAHGLAPQRLYQPHGCPHCREGFVGRRAVLEILPVDREIKKAVDARTNLDELREIGARNGIRTLFDKALILAAEGQIPMTEVWRVNVE